MPKVITSREAAALVQDNMTVAVGGFITYGVPEDCLVSLQKRYVETSSPKDLTCCTSRQWATAQRAGPTTLGSRACASV